MLEGKPIYYHTTIGTIVEYLNLKSTMYFYSISSWLKKELILFLFQAAKYNNSVSSQTDKFNSANY